MGNLEHAKSLLERAKQQADDWESEEAAVTFSIPLVSSLVEEIEKLRAALTGLVGAESNEELRAMEALIRITAAPDEDKASMLNAIHVLISSEATIIAGKDRDDPDYYG